MNLHNNWKRISRNTKAIIFACGKQFKPVNRRSNKRQEGENQRNFETNVKVSKDLTFLVVLYAIFCTFISFHKIRISWFVPRIAYLQVSCLVIGSLTRAMVFMHFQSGVRYTYAILNECESTREQVLLRDALF